MTASSGRPRWVGWCVNRWEMSGTDALLGHFIGGNAEAIFHGKWNWKHSLQSTDIRWYPYDSGTYTHLPITTNNYIPTVTNRYIVSICVYQKDQNSCLDEAFDLVVQIYDQGSSVVGINMKAQSHAVLRLLWCFLGIENLCVSSFHLTTQNFCHDDMKWHDANATYHQLHILLTSILIMSFLQMGKRFSASETLSHLYVLAPAPNKEGSPIPTCCALKPQEE